MNKKWFLLLLIPLLLFAGSKWFKWWLNRHIASIINNNSERQYNISYDELNIHPLYQGFTVRNVKIQPRNNNNQVTLNTALQAITLNNVEWIDLILNRHLTVTSLHFESPEISIIKQDGSDLSSKQKYTDRTLQSFFGEIISNITLNEFILSEGKVMSFQNDTTNLKYTLNHLDIAAYGIKSDSAVFQYTIPFLLDSINIDAGDLTYKVNDYSTATLEKFDFRSGNESIFIKGAKLSLAKRWDSLSVEMGYQTDLMEVSIDSILIKTGQVFNENNDWTLKGNQISLFQPVLNDFRNKNVPRPDEEKKPLFNIMLQKLPIPIDIDTLNIFNGTICYAEWPLKGERPGTICFEDAQANLFNINNTTKQDSLVCLISFKAKINGLADMEAIIEIPLDTLDRFYMDAKVGSFPAVALNETISPLIKFEARKGQIHQVGYHIQADSVGANCQLMMIYEDLQIEILKDSEIENDLLSLLANIFIKKTRTREDPHNFEEYYTERNIYRGPFHLIWKGMREGMFDILPTKSGKKLLEKKNEQP